MSRTTSIRYIVNAYDPTIAENRNTPDQPEPAVALAGMPTYTQTNMHFKMLRLS